MSRCVEPQPDAWQQNATFSELLQAPPAKQALASLETHLKPIFNSHALYSLETGQLIVKLHSLTSLLNRANLLPHLTPHDFKLGLHLAITPSLSQSASPCKDQPLHFSAFLNAVAFCAFYYPPLNDPSQIPTPRPHNESIPHFEQMLETARERLVAAIESPRSIDGKVPSPASSMAFATPYTTLPGDSPIHTVSSGVSASPGGEIWFTPAQSNIRTKLFQLEVVETPLAPHLEEDTETRINPIRSIPKITSEIRSESGLSDSLQEPTTDSTSDPRNGLLQCQPQSQSPSSQNTEVLTSLAHEQQMNDKITPRELAEVSELEESSVQQAPCEESEAASGNPFPSTQAQVRSTSQVQIPDEPTDNSELPAETNEMSSPECPSTDLASAPTTVPSHLPSPGSHFESPHLSCDAKTLQAISTAEPTSFRKLSFSGSESDSDSSSCYDHSRDDQDAMTRIDEAFDDGHPVEDCDECDEELCSDMILSYSLSSHTRPAEDTLIIQSLGDECQQHQAESASHLLEQDPAGTLSPETEEPALSEAVDVYDMSKSDDIGSGAIAAEDVNLDRLRIALGLPAVAFSEAGDGVLRTPLAQKPGTRIDDTDIEYDDEEDHTLLFDDGNESDGSELSMGTRETMRKLVEDHLSFHGTSFSQHYQSGHFYAEDQVVITPDRKSRMAFCDTFTTTYNALVEDGPFASEKTMTRRSQMTRLETDQVVHSADACDREAKEYALATDDTNYGLLSPVIGSRRGSYSSEISPDGLNLIKKQLALPHPFVPAGSTIGSSISSAPGTQDEKDAERNANIENPDSQRIVTVSPKKTHTVSEKSVAFSQHDVRASREVEMVHVMRETLETCRVLREEIARKQQPSIEPPRQQNYRGFGRIIEFGVFGLVIIMVTLLLVERRIQRSMFVDVLV